MCVAAVNKVGKASLRRCLSLDSSNLHTIDSMASKHQEFISHSSGAWEVKIKVLTDSVSGEGPFPHGLSSSHSDLTWQKGKGNFTWQKGKGNFLKLLV